MWSICYKYYWSIGCILCEAFAVSTVGVVRAYCVKHCHKYCWSIPCILCEALLQLTTRDVGVLCAFQVKHLLHLVLQVALEYCVKHLKVKHLLLRVWFGVSSSYCVKHLLQVALGSIVPCVCVYIYSKGSVCYKYCWSIGCILCEAFATGTVAAVSADYVKRLPQALLEQWVHIMWSLCHTYCRSTAWSICHRYSWRSECILCEAFATSTVGTVSAHYVKHLQHVLSEYCVKHLPQVQQEHWVHIMWSICHTYCRESCVKHLPHVL